MVPSPEIASKDIVGERAERGRRLRKPPRRVEGAAGGKPLNEIAVEIELIDEAVPRARHGGVERGVLFGVRDVELVADVLDVVRGVAGHRIRVGEASRESSLRPAAVKNVDRCLPEKLAA